MKPEGASEDSKRTTVNVNNGQSNRTEIMKTSVQVIRISQNKEKLMLNQENMTRLGHMVWSEKSQ